MPQSDDIIRPQVETVEIAIKAYWEYDYIR